MSYDLIPSLQLTLKSQLIPGVDLTVPAFGRFGWWWLADLLGSHSADFLLLALHFSLGAVNLLNVDISLPADFFLGHFQVSDNLEKPYFPLLSFDDLVLAVLDIDFQLLNLVMIVLKLLFLIVL